MNLINSLLKKSTIDYKDLIFICSNLASLIESEVSILNSLDIVESGLKNKTYIEAVKDIKKSINSGISITKAFEKTNIFPSMLISMLKAGEDSGKLSVSLDNITRFYEKQQLIINKILSATFYPMLLLIMVNIVFIYMLFNIIPQFQEMYNSLGVSTEGFVKVLFYISENIRELGYVFFIYYFIYIIFIPIIIFKILKICNFIKSKFKIFKIYEEYKFLSLMELMLSSGILIESAISIINSNEKESNFKFKIENMLKEIRKGDSLSLAIKRNNVLSQEGEILIRVGEETGTIEEKFELLKRITEGKLNGYLESFSNKIQPILIAIMAAIIGGFILTFMMPLYGAIR